MNIQSIMLLAGGYFIILLLLIRIEIRRRYLVVFVLLLPMVFFSIRWAGYKDSWAELIAAVSLAAVAIGSWWAIWGRKLPPPQGSLIRVWSDEDPFE
jgi:hypothetical protein